MGATSYKHEIKTIFLVINCSIALTIGLFSLSFGVAIVLFNAPETELGKFGTLVLGTLTLGLASVGHYGAFFEKRAVLRVYAAVVGLFTFVEVIAVFKFPKLLLGTLIFVIFHIAVTLSATTLAMVLAKLARRSCPALPSAPAPTAPTAL